MEFGQIVAPTIKELFIERIAGMIFSGALKPGDRLPSERDLAEQMKISKTIVHLGLEDMSRMGLIDVEPRRGTIVADFAKTGNLETLNAILRYNGGQLDRQMIISILELRSVIEGGALVRLGKSHTEQDIAVLRESISEFGDLVGTSVDIESASAKLAEFHGQICSLSGNSLYPLVMNAFRGVGSLLWESSVKFWGGKALYDQGVRTISLLEEGKGDEAASYLRALLEHYIENHL